jgi:cell division protein FtsB
MEVWRDISLMWLILLTFVAILPFGVVFFFAIKGLWRLRQLAERFFPQVQEQARLVAEKTEEVSEQVAQPLVELYARAEKLNTMTRTILRRNRT